MVFKQDDTNLKHIFSDHVGTDMSFDEFKNICRKAWEGKYDFLVVNKEESMSDGRYRIGFDRLMLLN